MIKRRRFLLGGLGLAALAALSVWGAGVAFESEIAIAIRRRLAFLRIDEAGLHSFAKDYLQFAKGYARSKIAQHPSWYSWKFHLYSLFRGQVDRLGLSHDTRSRRQRLEEYWATMFLLSSDFFVTGANESRVVRYVVLYDPIRACGSPFSRPAFDSAAEGQEARVGSCGQSIQPVAATPCFPRPP
jgi:hypothetical protein